MHALQLVTDAAAAAAAATSVDPFTFVLPLGVTDLYPSRNHTSTPYTAHVNDGRRTVI